jgi:hypothetical protein
MDATPSLVGPPVHAFRLELLTNVWASAHRVPGVAIVVGAVEALSMMTELALQFSWYSSIDVSNYAHPGAIEYSCRPVLVNQG